MSELADFLLARIAEDEQIARTAADYDSDSEGGHWFADGGSVGPGKTPGWYQFEYVGAEHAEHMARWDPARVLAECEAKRRIVDEEQTCRAGGYADAMVFALEVLALPYADHPDYREEWRP